MSGRRTWQDLRLERASADPDFDQHAAQARLRHDLAQLVYDLRTSAGLTQAELARRMGTTQSAIARLEGAGTNPSAELLQRLGNAVGARLILTAHRAAGADSAVILSEPAAVEAS
ncbi:MAG: helix-turn-helix domain-containing protein [Nitriliruptorales bacterium]|nr:helix-turn-helix domain-containing protein [Nitriliruptorales bacterium]